MTSTPLPALALHRPASRLASGPPRCWIVPPHLLRHLAEADEPVLVELAERMLRLDTALREQRAAAGRASRRAAGAPAGPAWQVHDAEGTETLPGELVRGPGDPETGDQGVDEAALGLEATQALLTDWGRSSYDGEGSAAVTTVHFGQDYANAFWDGGQLVFGDGDGVLFGRFTEPVDVLGHELAHALTQYTAGLVHSRQPGALNESMSDVVGACVKQRLLGEEAADADWLIGEGIFVAGVQGVALRSMAAPGTAYDDPSAGTRPAARAHGRLRRDHRRQRRGPHQLRHPQQGVPAGRDRHRRHQLGGGRADLVRRAHLRHPGHLRLRDVSRPPPWPPPGSTRRPWRARGSRWA